MTSPELHAEVRTHGVREFTTVNDDVERVAEELRINGWALMDSGFDAGRLPELSDGIDRAYRQQVEELGGEHRLREMNDANIARAPSAADDVFVEVALLPSLHAVCRAVLGEAYILMSQNGIINPPGTDHYQFTWHRDLNYQHYTSSRPLALSAMLCVDPFDATTGGTYILPGTHKMEAFPSEGFVRAHQRVVEAGPGWWILFDSMIYHRTGQNRSDRIRRGVNHIITLPLIKQQYSFPNMLQRRTDLDDAARRYFGYHTETAPDATEWRRGKLALRDAMSEAARKTP